MKIDQAEVANYYLTIISPESTKQNWPVVYLHDGASFLADESFIERIVNHQLDRFIIVGITSNNRDDDYTPWPSKVAQISYQGLGDQYLDIVTKDIKDYVDKNYSTQSDYNNTAMVGASLGGLISMYASVVKPNTFRYIGCISPSFWYEGFEKFMLKQSNLNDDLYYHLTIGTGETKSFVKEGSNAVEAFNNIINHLIKNNDNIHAQLSDQYFHKLNSFQDRLILYLKDLTKEIKRNKK